MPAAAKPSAVTSGVSSLAKWKTITSAMVVVTTKVRTVMSSRRRYPSAM